jgi:Flp pilus assembly protein TadG
MMRWLGRVSARRRGERGVTLPMVALTLVGLFGFTALSVDIGRLATTRRQLQNAADAAALAGAFHLPSDRETAAAKAVDWATRNGLQAFEVTDVTVSTTNFADDTIDVTVKRTVKHTFARVLGLLSRDVTATARVTVYRVVGADTQAGGLFPYAVWGGNKGGPQEVSKPGTKVTFRSNQYARVNVKPNPTGCSKPATKENNCNWNINSSNFKGYFHWKDRYVYIDLDTRQSVNQGGNSFGTEPVDDLVKAQRAGNPVWLPVVTWADDFTNNLHFTIVHFVCVELDAIDTSGSADWTGTVLDPASDVRCRKAAGLREGGDLPPNPITPQYTFVLTK